MRKEHKQQTAQKNFLAYQVKLKKDLGNPFIVTAPLSNLFARDETNTIIVKKEIDKVCFENQTEMAGARLETKIHDKMVEDSNYLKQLNYSQLAYAF